MNSSVAKTFFLIAFPGAIALVGIVYGAMEFRHYLLNSPRFSVQAIEVLTSGLVDKETIIKQSKIGKGLNIFTLDLEEARKNIEKNPWVYSATVMRALPNKIQIQYEPQKAVAILGGEEMRYLNREGHPFYHLEKGDSLKYPLLQIEGGKKEPSINKERLAGAVDLLFLLRESKIFSDEDLGDFTVRLNTTDGSSPYVLTMKYPPSALLQKDKQDSRLYTASFSEENMLEQVNRWGAVTHYLMQHSRIPKLVRMELGKKVVVKLDR